MESGRVGPETDADDLMMRIESSDLAALAKDLKKFEPELRKELAVALKAVAVVVRDDVRTHAPRHLRKAIKSQVRFGAKEVRVAIIGDVKVAPDVWLWEKGGRHPVFGREVWVHQDARPYMDETASKHLPEVEEAVSKAADEAMKKSLHSR